MPTQRRSTVIAAAISLLLHGLVFWWIVAHRVPPPLRDAGNRDPLTTLVMIAPPEASPRASAPAQRATPPFARRTPARPKAAPQIRPAPHRLPAPPHPQKPTVNALPAITLPLPLPAPAKVAPSVPTEDFSSQLAARQQRRAQEESQEQDRQTARGTPEQQDNERGKQVALANIASQLRSAGLEKEEGGLFQLQSVGAHHAEFLFRGWKKEAHRNWSQQVTVEQGGETDVRIAVVKKMIQIIRDHTQEDFTWESHRLGKKIHLSARTEDTIGLQQFLLREFFPDFAPAQR